MWNEVKHEQIKVFSALVIKHVDLVKLVSPPGSMVEM